MNEKIDSIESKERAIVYVRPVAVSDLPEDLRSQVPGRDTVYSVHTADGEQVALVEDETMAFVLARQNDLAPVHVH